MYTFILTTIVTILVFAVIYGKNVKNKVWSIFGYIVLFNFIAIVVVNSLGVRSSEYKKVHHKTITPEGYVSDIIVNDSTVAKLKTGFAIDMEITEEDDTIHTFTSCDIGSFRGFGIPKEDFKTGRIKIERTEDSIPKVKMYKVKRSISSKWRTKFANPPKRTIYVFCFPEEKKYNILLNYINTYIYDKNNTPADTLAQGKKVLEKK